MHAAQKWTRFWDNDMHESKRLKARRMDPCKHDALQRGTRPIGVAAPHYLFVCASDQSEKARYARFGPRYSGQAPVISFPALDIHDPAFSRGASPLLCRSL
ncbi:hypothetical protein FJ938_17115 [Mesorhizobium sp. B2-4-14]|nr:hypothetical protein FJ548_23875 [Mesorhizobium sp. B2-4-17]TPL03999.1 hypothetical protein FJ938_17115 [Mesorhizobium sp. B2-4-14]